MRKTVTVTMCVLALLSGAAACGPVFAGPIENASEFQDEVIQREEERSMNEPGAGAGSITWSDDSIVGADSGDETGQ